LTLVRRDGNVSQLELGHSSIRYWNASSPE